MSLIRGRIIYATFPDENGRNPKPGRPAVLLHDAQQLQPTDPIVVVAISGTFAFPLPATKIQLPHSNDHRGPAMTKLTKPSVAVCTWIPNQLLDQIEGIGGFLPAGY